MKLVSAFIALLFLSMTASPASAQSPQAPSRALVEQAKAIVADSVFARVAAREADELAEWIVGQVHSDASGSTRTHQVSQFQSQFRMIVQDGPSSAFGAMDGFDLLQESPLRGTDRYFRLMYMTYHQRTPLVWEFHFYVQPDGGLSLALFNFSGQNPFEYMSTSDKLIDHFSDLP